MRKVWRFSGGWTLRYRHRPAIGIKPPRLLAKSDRSMGEMIFIEEPDFKKKMEHLTCHELTHAFSAHLKLPLWLNEGIAMVTVDKYLGHATVRSETLRRLNRPQHRGSAGKYRNLPAMSKEVAVYHYVRGYWITRFLMDTHPGLLKELLQKKHHHRLIEKKIAAALGVSNKTFWEAVDERVIAHFGENSIPSEPQGEADGRQPLRSGCIGESPAAASRRSP
jgi:hypothetical protein